MAMPMRHPSGPLCLAATALLFAATSPAQNTAGAQTSGQEAVAADRSGASAQGSAAGAAHADDTSANLANGSSVNAVLTKPVDSRHTKPGDPVSARTTQNARTEGGTSIPKGSTLMGHVSDAHAAAEDQAGSSVGIVFDKAVTRDGHEIALRNVGIQAVAAAEANAASSAGEVAPMTGAMTSAGGGAGMSRGGGLLGRTGAVGGTVGSGLGAAGSVGSLAGGAAGTLQAGPGAMGGLDAAGMLTAGSTGVFGLRGLSLSGGAAGAAMGSVMTSSGKSVHLDQGTRLLLSSQAAASSQGGASQPSGTGKPDPKRPSADRR